MNEYSASLTFQDHGENQTGYLCVRTFGNQVAISLSLEKDGDVEALIDKSVVEKLIEMLQTSIAQQG
jgi:hypothetical protein